MKNVSVFLSAGPDMTASEEFDDEQIIERDLSGERPAGSIVHWDPDDEHTAKPADWGTSEDPWVSRTRGLLDDPVRRALGVTTAEVASELHALSEGPTDERRAQAARVHAGIVLRALQWAPRAQATVNGRKQARRYYPTGRAGGLSSSLPSSPHGGFRAAPAPAGAPPAGKTPDMQDPSTWVLVQKSMVPGLADWVRVPTTGSVVRRPVAYMVDPRLERLVARRNDLLRELSEVDSTLAALKGAKR